MLINYIIVENKDYIYQFNFYINKKNASLIIFKS